MSIYCFCNADYAYVRPSACVFETIGGGGGGHRLTLTFDHGFN